MGFARKWPSLNKATISNISSIVETEKKEGSDQDEDDSDIENQNEMIGQRCKGNCLVGCLTVIMKYSFFCSSYETLFIVYKTLLTIPITQVCCERAFSQLKLIKTRLRSTTSPEYLEASMFMKLNSGLISGS